MAKAHLLRLAVAAVGLVASPAAAIEQAANSQAYPPEYFASAHPADAYDMVKKLPGFEIVEGDEDVRGFTGSRGNVLFDGRVPSGKQESLQQMLRRIPAASVLRIELIRGGANSSATGGYDVVANVIRKPAAAAWSGAAFAGFATADEIGFKPKLRFELSRENGSRRLNAAAELDADIDDDSGEGSIVERSADGVETGFERRDESEWEERLGGNADYKLPLGSGDLAANASLLRTLTSERVASGDSDGESLATDRERHWSGEAGLQYSTELGKGDLEGLVSYRFGRVRANAAEEDESFRESTRTSEAIARAEYRRGNDQLSIFTSAEAALNRLSSEAELLVAGLPVPVSGSDVEVSERRGEGALGAVWKVGGSLTIEPSIRVEASTIKSTGDSAQDESFLFWKPRLRMSWSRGASRLELTAEREAAQLDFGDFVASVELDRNDITAGAQSLRPPTTWSIAVTYEWQFWNKAALLLTARHEWIKDVIDRVVVESDGELFDAVGNIGSGNRDLLHAQLTLPLDHWGLDGLQIRANLTWLRSRVTDPITGERRVIAEDRPFEGDLRLIHDARGGKWSWGVDTSFAHHEQEFRLDEVRAERKGASVGAYIEFRPRADWRLRLEGENITSRRLVDVRDKYADSRESGVIETIESRRLRTSPIVSFSVRRSVGGGIH